MAPGGTLFRFAPHFGENVLPHGSHEWLPYSKDEVRLKTVNNNFRSLFPSRSLGIPLFFPVISNKNPNCLLCIR